MTTEQDAQPVSADDFGSLPWPELDSVLAFDQAKTTADGWLKTASAAGPSRAARLVGALLALRPDRREAADCPFHETRGFADIYAPDLGVLVELGERIPSPLVRARAVDLAWWNRSCSHKDVVRAVSDYCTLATTALDPDRWLDAYDCIARAVSLGAGLGRGSEAHRQAVDCAARLVASVADRDARYFSLRAAQLLLDHRYGGLKELVPHLQGIASRAAAATDADRAVQYLDLTCRIQLRLGDKEGARATRVDAARVQEQAAAAAAAADEMMIAASRQEQAVQIWREAGSSSEDVKRARVVLQDFQRRAVAQLKAKGRHSSEPIDLSDFVAGAREHVGGRPLGDALVALALLRRPNESLDRLREAAKRSVGEFLFYSLSPMTQVSRAGRTVHRRPSAIDDSDVAVESVFRSDLSVQQQLLALGAIVPACETVQLDHGITTATVHAFAARSAFVAPGQAFAYAKGLAFGFQGDFWTAAHLLMPLFENAIRCQLEARGAVVSTLPSSGSQNELDLVALLDLKEAAEYFGAEELCAMKSLLVEKAGTNLRNELAHGLLEDANPGALLVYFWWKTFQYMIIPLIPALTEARASIDPVPQTDIAGADPAPAPVGADR